MIAGLILISVAVFCHYVSFYIFLHPSQEVEYELPNEDTIKGNVHSKTELEIATFLFNVGILPLIFGIITIIAGIFKKETDSRSSDRIEEPRHKSIEDIIREQDPGKKKCKQCWGSGKCNVCEGTGIIVSGISKKESCNVCKGSGLCSECSGYGGKEKK